MRERFVAKQEKATLATFPLGPRAAPSCINNEPRSVNERFLFGKFT